MGNSCDGIILIDKNKGWTSHDVVKKVREVQRIKKVGHAGTLDPFATGLLIILLGQGTKLSSYIMRGEKRYRAIMRLGGETDTLDLTGRTVKTSRVPDMPLEYIMDTAQMFTGEIEQIPPAFSAVRYKGKRAYELARKGIKVDLKKRRVNIRSLKIVSVKLPDIAMDVICSHGTYIRTLAADMGRQLGPGGHLIALRRLSSGPFLVEDALTLDKKSLSPTNNNLTENIISLQGALPDMKEIQIDGQMAGRIRNGCLPRYEDLMEKSGFSEGCIKLVRDSDLVAIIKIYSLRGDTPKGVKIMRAFIKPA